MALPTLSPANARCLIDAGARLVDIRDADEHAREHIPGAVSLPLDRITDLTRSEHLVVFHCRSGMRTAANAAGLAGAAQGAPAYILNGGIDAWRRDGHPIITNRKQPIEMMRQVQITAGALVLSSVLLGFLLAPGFLGVSAFVGAGLVFAGTTGRCGMARLLRIMPWNRQAAA
ncbi:rhodanese family protein [Sphingomonas sp. Leaf10]|uniref:rhodanese family protein n=1 Tax=Sphingomonas sp. Leaf10 TaxID=1735676 RepID=UPI0006F1D764|nr:rhodanese family protein [Sphingomonas sp. Leaf10]KQM30464.1 hypothetical protein ASE59_07745 [Sphingomonas sp. Leaf10]